MIYLDQARSDLIDEAKGFYLIRKLYSDQEVDHYRAACERFLRHGKHIHERIITNTIEDYVHPRSHDAEERTARIYQYLHNHRDDMVGRFIGRAITIRDEIEKAWLDHPVYRLERGRLFDYVIVTQYYGNKGMLAKHADYDGPAPFPLIQLWVALSQPGKDYLSGNLVLYSKNGVTRRIESDLNVLKGDAIVFDKSLSHEVELTGVADPDALGRWTVLIGARAPMDDARSAAKKRWLYGPPLYAMLSWGAATLKRVGLRQ